MDQMLISMTTVVTQIIVKPLLSFPWVMNIFAPKLKSKQQQAVKILHDFTEKIIDERRNLILFSNDPQVSSVNVQDDVGRKRKMALLDVLLQSTIDGKPLSNDDIREEVDTLFTFEGHDTTTSGISFSLYCLSRHPEIQEKVFAEIRAIIGDDPSKSASLSDLNELKYMELFIKESMRLYPPVPFIGRMLEEDLHIDGGIIPSGTEVHIPIFLLLKDPKVFSNPDNFEPERFTAASYNENLNPYAYIPFSAGPRNCIGQKYAMLEMKSTISKVLRHYELLPMGETPITIFGLVTRSKNGVNLGIRKRIYE